MKINKALKFIVVLTIAGGIAGCSYINKKLNLPDDHPAEQFLEDYIEDKVGIEIDLSPDQLP